MQIEAAKGRTLDPLIKIKQRSLRFRALDVRALDLHGVSYIVVTQTKRNDED